MSDFITVMRETCPNTSCVKQQKWTRWWQVNYCEPKRLPFKERQQIMGTLDLCTAREIWSWTMTNGSFCHSGGYFSIIQPQEANSQNTKVGMFCHRTGAWERHLGSREKRFANTSYSLQFFNLWAETWCRSTRLVISLLGKYQDKDGAPIPLHNRKDWQNSLKRSLGLSHFERNITLFWP